MPRTALMLSAAAMLVLSIPVAAQEYKDESQQQPSTGLNQQQQPGSGASQQQQQRQQQTSPQQQQTSPSPYGGQDQADQSQNRNQQAQGPIATPTLEFYVVQSSDVRASDLLGMEVYNAENQDIGEIEEILLDSNHNIKAIVIDVGDFLGVSDREIALQPQAVVVQILPGGDARARIQATRDQLSSAPEFHMAQAGRPRGQHR